MGSTRLRFKQEQSWWIEQTMNNKKRFQEHLGIHEGIIHLQNLLIKQLDLSIDTFQMVYLPEWNDFRWTSGWTRFWDLGFRPPMFITPLESIPVSNYPFVVNGGWLENPLFFHGGLKLGKYGLWMGYWKCCNAWFPEATWTEPSL